MGKAGLYTKMCKAAKKYGICRGKRLPTAKQLDEMIPWYPAKWDEKSQSWFPAKYGAFFSFCMASTALGLQEFNNDDKAQWLGFVMLKKFKRRWDPEKENWV